MIIALCGLSRSRLMRDQRNLPRVKEQYEYAGGWWLAMADGDVGWVSVMKWKDSWDGS